MVRCGWGFQPALQRKGQVNMWQGYKKQGLTRYVERERRNVPCLYGQIYSNKAASIGRQEQATAIDSVIRCCTTAVPVAACKLSILIRLNASMPQPPPKLETRERADGYNSYTA